MALDEPKMPINPTQPKLTQTNIQSSEQIQKNVSGQ
jgi:hypothetical protein